MTRLIDLEDRAHVFCGEDGEYEKWNIDPDAPTIDAVPVIRCKDCKWCVELYDIDIDTIVPYLQCTNWNGMTDADGYCCVAERKEE